MKLPQEFLDRMKFLLKDEYDEFIESYKKDRNHGLRVNTLKTGVEEFLKNTLFPLRPVPWTSDGFYYPVGENPGRHPYYHAGLYYIQEPSAMLPGRVIDAQQGEKILDICAAPGGKSVQIAAGMKQEGLLVCNDISEDRVKALVKNIELCGVRNAVVTNETPEKLAAGFQGFFDRILVDAPCSGEGMFRKDEDAARSWEKYKCERCASMQDSILDSAEKMLKPGGYLVYSTCTFAPEENEQMINKFINKYTYFELEDIPKTGGMASGRPEWGDGRNELARCARLWPHKLEGEGHFVAKLRKGNDIMLRKRGSDGKPGSVCAKGKASCEKNVIPEYCFGCNTAGKVLQPFYDFVNEYLTAGISTCFNPSLLQMNGTNLYMIPYGLPDMKGIKAAKFGWYLGSIDKNRFEPSHSFLMGLSLKDFVNVINFPSNSREIYSYLKGETLMTDSPKGWNAVCVDGYPVGWAKQAGGILKNLYPRGWRKMA